MSNSIPFISDQQVSEALDYRSVAAVLDEAFASLAAAGAAVHRRQRTDCRHLRLSTMGAVWADRGVGGVKVYPTVRGQFSFSILLFDLASTRPRAERDSSVGPTADVSAGGAAMFKSMSGAMEVTVVPDPTRACR